jgi:hypothetical protein
MLDATADRIGQCAPSPLAILFTPSSSLAEAKSLLKRPALCASSWCWNPLMAYGSVAYLAWLFVYFSGKSGSFASTLWKSPSTNSCEVQVSP